MLDTDDGGGKSKHYVSPYLLIAPRILRDACRETRRDQGGLRCPLCSLREFCEAQASRAGRLGAPPVEARRVIPERHDAANPEPKRTELSENALEVGA